MPEPSAPLGASSVTTAGPSVSVVTHEVRARPFPVPTGLFPTVTRSRLARLAGVLAAVWATGAVGAGLASGPWATLAAGLLLPGGTFLAHGQVAAAAVSLLAFVVALTVWWMIGAALAPLLVWLVATVWATLTAAGAPIEGAWLAVAVGTGPVTLVLTLAVHAWRHRRQVAAGARVNAELARVTFTLTALPSAPTLPVREATADDLAHLRHALDLALQPLEEFTGFDRRDQFREAALRYQICILGYALSTFRYTHAPAFAGYLAEAQELAILKTGDRRVWGYWGIENAWGRFSLARDPIDNNDNIMLTGWQGVAVGMYEALQVGAGGPHSQESMFSRPGGLTYTWSPTERYEYDFHALAGSVHRNMRDSPYTLFSCEPRWIYPVCNTFGANTLVLHDRLHGTDHLGDVRESLLRSYEEEFCRPDGRLIGVRNETLGLSWNLWATEGVSLPTTFWMHSFLPELAHRQWWLTRRSGLVFDGERYLLPRTALNRIDGGSYALGSDSFAHTLLSMTARELGDDEVADHAFAHVAQQEQVETVDGVSRYAGLSTQGNLYSLVARFGRPSGTRDLIAAGVPDAWRDGPRLAQAPYPQALVARAVTDGEALDVVLLPGTPRGAARVTLVLDRLAPLRTYSTRGATSTEVVADADGRAVVQVDLGSRHCLRIEPTA